MVFRTVRERAKGRGERSDGRAFDPADVDDGMPRVIITVDAANPYSDGSLPVHIDYFNIGGETTADRERNVDQLLTLANKTWLRSQVSGNVSHVVPARSERGKR